MMDRFWAKVDKTGGEDACWVWTGGKLESGYGQFKLRSYVRVSSHRLSYEWANGAIPDGMFVCHKCDNPPCVNPAHLFLGTPKDNMHDMIDKGRRVLAPAIGEKNGRAVLTVEKVAEIRASSVPYRKLAAQYGVGLSQIGRIKSGEQWANA